MTLRRRIVYLGLATLFVFLGGIAGFYVLGHTAQGHPSLLDCAYQTVITLATVGSREMHPLVDTWYGKLFVIWLVLSGMGVLVALVTQVTAFFVEGELASAFRRRRMDRAIQAMRDHFIVCGAGGTGSYVIRELRSSGHQVVVVDVSEERLQRLVEAHPGDPLPYVVGQAADDEVLEKAGLERARGMVVALPDERDNLFITVTARQTNPGIRLVVSAADARAERRLKRAGADAVVSPSRIGGMRMASEMVRPEVVGFLDNMLHAQERPLRIEEIPLGPGSQMAGKALRDANLRKEADLLVLAIRDPASGQYLYNPGPDHVLEVGTTLIVLGPVESVHRVRQHVSED
jgi:voltage-gated potassium channel